MRLVFNDIFTSELKEYLLSQDGINKVSISVKDYISEINIDFDKKLTPKIIVKYIELFQEQTYPAILEFDKGGNIETNVLKYTVDDMCCEYCYEGFVYDLFDNVFVKSLKSNFRPDRSAVNIELVIEYDKNYREEDLLSILKGF